MRWALIVVAVTACGNDRYGTYFIADGRAAKIGFDHAEFYFGDRLGNAFATPAGPQKGEVYHRLLNAADVTVPTDHAAQEATYYVAPDGDTNVGSYVLVIARDAQNAIVGVGEASKFTLASGNEVIEIRATLEAPGSNVQQWGADPACISWTRHQSSPVAFVRDNDRDCDGAVADVDCNDLLYCGPNDPSCDTTPSICSVPCAIGCRSAGVCVPSACVFADACNAGESCAMKATLTEVLKCFATSGGLTHLDVRLPTGPQNGHMNIPCVYQFSVPMPPGTQCANPAILFTEPFTDGYQFGVQDGGSSCKFQLNMQQPAVPFVGDHHLLVAIDPPGGVGPRSTFLFGVNPLASMTVCTSMVSSENQLTIDSCQ